MVGHERLVRRLDEPDLEAEALRVGEREAVAVARHLDALRFRRSSQNSTASAEPTRQTTVWTIPRPARPRRAPGYSKNVMSEPALPASSA